MNKTTCFSLLFFILSSTAFSQSIDDPFSKKKMRRDFEVFKNIRLKANSGLYKYRIKEEIDSIYNWAHREIDKSSTYREFYIIILQLTDFEGSLHNDTALPKKIFQSLKNEESGYFPIPIKWIANKWIVNFDKVEIPLGAEIISINDEKIENIIIDIYKYYTTDGVNTTGKTIGINRNFSRYYRLEYGSKESFKVAYKTHNSDQVQVVNLKTASYATYYENFENRFSKTYDKLDYISSDHIKEKYSYKTITNQTGILTINTFNIGQSASDPKHKTYVQFLDSIFSKMKANKIKNLIVDIRHNGGGTDPNDLVTYSYLTQRDFSENKQAWISFNKIPYLKHIDSKVPSFLRPLGVGKYNEWLQKEFYIKKETGFHQGPLSQDHKIRTPNKNAFKGKVYLLISPKIASAGSLLASMVAGNKNTTIIGQETMGAYYGHNGHTPITYVLPKSKLETTFSIVNLEQDVPKRENQVHNRGIIPDDHVTHTYEDYLKHKDTQMDFVLDLIEKEKR